MSWALACSCRVTWVETAAVPCHASEIMQALSHLSDCQSTYVIHVFSRLVALLRLPRCLARVGHPTFILRTEPLQAGSKEALAESHRLLPTPIPICCPLASPPPKPSFHFVLGPLQRQLQPSFHHTNNSSSSRHLFLKPPVEDLLAV